MKLSDEQVNSIEQTVEAQGLKIRTLKDDVIDHLCCVIENEIGKGSSFDQLLEKAIMDLAPNGLIEIENKTIFLLNSKRIIAMKKLMYLMGFIGALTLTVAVAFKLLHYPGANALFVIGYLTLLLLFIPFIAFDRYKVTIANVLSERLKIILGATASVILGLAGLFKILHLQGADILLVLGAMVFALGFLPFYFFRMYKKSVS